MHCTAPCLQIIVNESREQNPLKIRGGGVLHNDEIINLIGSTVNISRLLDCEYLLLQAVSYDCVKTVQIYVVSDLITLYTLSISFSRKILYIL